MARTAAVPTPTPAMIAAAQNVIGMRKTLADIQPKVEAIHDQILAELQPKDEDGSLVNWFDLYLCADEVSDACFELASERCAAAGLFAPTGCCPLLVAQTKVRDAERTMNIAAQELIPENLRVNIGRIYDPAEIKKLTDLNLSFITQNTRR